MRRSQNGMQLLYLIPQSTAEKRLPAHPCEVFPGMSPEKSSGPVTRREAQQGKARLSFPLPGLGPESEAPSMQTRGEGVLNCNVCAATCQYLRCREEGYEPAWTTEEGYEPAWTTE